MTTIGKDLGELGLRDIPEHPSFSDELLSVIRDAAAQGVAEPRFRNLLPDAAEWLASLVIEEGIKTVIELGTSNGYSALVLGGALEYTHGHLTTYEKYPDRACLAKDNISRAHLEHRVTVKTGDGVGGLRNHQSPIDLLFMDIWPGDYIVAVENARQALHRGSIIVADNMLEHRDRLGQIHSAAGSGAQEYLEFIERERRCRSVLLSKGCGLLITRVQ